MMKQSNCKKKRMLVMRFLLTIITFFWGYVYSTAQNQKTRVSGVVTSDSNKLPPPGVSIVDLSDPKNVLITDFDGRYTIPLKSTF